MNKHLKRNTGPQSTHPTKDFRKAEAPLGTSGHGLDGLGKWTRGLLFLVDHLCVSSSNAVLVVVVVVVVVVSVRILLIL